MIILEVLDILVEVVKIYIWAPTIHSSIICLIRLTKFWFWQKTCVLCWVLEVVHLNPLNDMVYNDLGFNICALQGFSSFGTCSVRILLKFMPTDDYNDLFCMYYVIWTFLCWARSCSFLMSEMSRSPGFLNPMLNSYFKTSCLFL